MGRGERTEGREGYLLQILFKKTINFLVGRTHNNLGF